MTASGRPGGRGTGLPGHRRLTTRATTGVTLGGLAGPTDNHYQRNEIMAAYKCDKCGMSVGTMTCGTCGKELVHSSLTKDDGSTVHISECPDGHGKIKSPMCCGQDMTCAIG